ncbi:MAG TPA: glycosyltransferase family 39 protein [Terracidiphilus sp.]|nr:glycosyltransferase family 39 protein [Terracidiphilus sp.]
MSIALALAGGALMRLLMLKAIPQVSGDTLLYGNLAKSLLHGQFAITDSSGVAHETLIRLPGYPVFLAACFRLFGLDNYTAVSYVQIALELVGCLLLAAFVRRIATEAAAHWTLWLAALCPFTASYTVAPLTETPTLFAIALALWALARFHARPGWGNALAFTFAITFAALLRPDGALVAVALAPGLVLGLLRGADKGASAANALADSAQSRPDAARSCPVPFWSRNRAPSQPVQPELGNRPSAASLLRMGLVCVVLALLPFAIWTARNWRVFHVFEPLAPRYATDPGESANPGWQRWVKTWCLDFVSTYDIYWNVPGSALDLTKLPSRAFDSPAQYEETAALAAAYADNGQDLSPDLDAGFAQLAEERVRAHPLRYYLWLPLGRMADMWLRPRVENLNIDLDWWVYNHHHAETRFSWAYAGLNAAYLLLALAGLALRPRYSIPGTKTLPWGPRLWPWMVLYFVLRSALLMTIEAPEARYTLECFPMLFALGGIGICAGYSRIVQAFARR